MVAGMDRYLLILLLSRHVWAGNGINRALARRALALPNATFGLNLNPWVHRGA